MILDWLFHRRVRSGETVRLHLGDGTTSEGIALVQGWGKYASVRVGKHTIRRDGIWRSERGNWFYRFEG